MHYLKDPKLWNYGIFLIMGHAGFCPSTVVLTGLIVTNYLMLLVYLIH